MRSRNQLPVVVSNQFVTLAGRLLKSLAIQYLHGPARLLNNFLPLQGAGRFGHTAPVRPEHRCQEIASDRGNPESTLPCESSNHRAKRFFTSCTRLQATICEICILLTIANRLKLNRRSGILLMIFASSADAM